MSSSPHEEQKTVWAEDVLVISDFLTALAEVYLLRTLVRKGKDPNCLSVDKERLLLREHSKERFSNGLHAFSSTHLLSLAEEEESKEEFSKAALLCKQALDENSIDAFILQHLQGHASLRKVLKLSDRTMQRCYRVGYDLLKQERFDEAADFFWLLSALDSFVSVYWLGLGIADQQRARYKEALYAYTMATISDETNPLPQFRSAQCYAAISDLPLATNSLDLCIAQCEDDPKYATLKAQALAWKEKL